MLHCLSPIEQVDRGDILVRHLRHVVHLRFQSIEFRFQKKLDIWAFMHLLTPSPIN
jgi:hypothetical protein